MSGSVIFWAFVLFIMAGAVILSFLPPLKSWNWQLVWAGISALSSVSAAVISWYSYSTVSKQLEASQYGQRPWLRANISPGPFFVSKGDVVALDLEFKLKNIGKSPAILVRTYAWLEDRYRFEPRLIRALAETRCDKAKFDPPQMSNVFDVTIFPEDEIKVPHAALIRLSSPGEMEQRTTDIALWLYGCVQYQFTLDGTIHQTPFAYRVGEQVDTPKGPAANYGFEGNQVLPGSKIYLLPESTAAPMTD